MMPRRRHEATDAVAAAEVAEQAHVLRVWGVGVVRVLGLDVELISVV
jgi:hypothetical protein